MSKLHRTWITLSFWLLAAHALRFGYVGTCIVLALLPGLLLLSQTVITKILQLGLFAGAFFWIYTTYGMLNMRLAMGGDWERMFAIMSGVIVFTLYSACICDEASSSHKPIK
ncbi:TPA: hypothetical protein ACX6RX_000094 [Photobacterium damselae]